MSSTKDMIECNHFQVEAEVLQQKRPRLKWAFYTDLPCGTLVGVDASRRYRDHGGESCLWTLYSEAIEVVPTARGDFNGASGDFSIDDCDKKGLADFEELLGAFSKGVKEPVSDEIELSCIVGGRQPLRAFGKSNRNLCGACVETSGDVNVIHASAVVVAPGR